MITWFGLAAAGVFTASVLYLAREVRRAPLVADQYDRDDPPQNLAWPPGVIARPVPPVAGFVRYGCGCVRMAGGTLVPCSTEHDEVLWQQWAEREELTS